MSDCVFCSIVQGEIPAHKVSENSSFLAFLDVKPHAKGHTVIIPKKHGVTVFDYSDLDGLMSFVKEVMQKIDEKLNPDGFNVGWNHNSAAGQVVPHLHIHIMPRYNGDGGGSMHSIVNNAQVSVEEVAGLFE